MKNVSVFFFVVQPVSRKARKVHDDARTEQTRTQRIDVNMNRA